MTKPRKISKYGWAPDLPDHRDKIYEETVDTSSFPAIFSLRSEEPPIYDQAQLGSCTANAIAFAVDHQRSVQGESFITPSRLFIYFNERQIEGTVDQDAGAQIRDGIKVVASEGVPPESEWPYSDANPGPFQQQPPTNVYNDATRFKAVNYQRINPVSPDAIRTAVFQHRPVVFGFSVPASFEDPNWNPANTYLRIPNINTQIIGGHAVAVVGWDFSKTRFRDPVFEIRNSWGSGWGDQGHFYMDYKWFQIGGIASDFWVITLES